MTRRFLVALIALVSITSNLMATDCDISVKVSSDSAKKPKIVMNADGTVCENCGEEAAEAPADAAKTRAWDPARGGITTPAFQYPIKSSDFSTPLTSGDVQYTIQNRGRYYLANDISSRSNGLAVSVMLSITASNVTLDMNNKTMRPSQGTNSTSLTAINVANGLSNVTIKNGQISGNSATSSDVAITQGITVGQKCHNIVIDDVQVVNIGGNGINLNGATGANTNEDVLISNCVVSGCKTITDSLAIQALDATFCNNLTIRDCRFDNLDQAATTTGAAATGALFTSCNNVKVSNCKADGITSSGGGTAVGFQAESGSNYMFKGCTANRLGNDGTSTGSTGFCAKVGPVRFIKCESSDSNGASVASYGFHSEAANTVLTDCTANSNTTAATTGCFGIFLTGSAGSTIKRCKANNNTGVAASGGIQIAASSHGCILTDCETRSNVASGGLCYGVLISSSNSCRLTNCDASENQTTTADNDCYGFGVTASAGVRFENCNADHNNTSTSGGDAVGFDFASGSGSCIVANSFARYNEALHATAAHDACGFRVTGCNNNEFTNCIASGNTIADGNLGYAAGFDVVSGSARTSINKCDSSSNYGGTTGSAYGVYLEHATSVTNTTIRDCNMKFNAQDAAATSGNIFGIYDNATDTTSIMFNNIAIGHGRCIALLDTSYDFPTSTSMNFYFKATCDEENPANIILETDNFNWQVMSTKTDWHNVSVVVGEVS